MLSGSSGSGMGWLCYHGVVALVWDCYLTLNTDSYLLEDLDYRYMYR